MRLRSKIVFKKLNQKSLIQITAYVIIPATCIAFTTKQKNSKIEERRIVNNPSKSLQIFSTSFLIHNSIYIQKLSSFTSLITKTNFHIYKFFSLHLPRRHKRNEETRINVQICSSHTNELTYAYFFS